MVRPRYGTVRRRELEILLEKVPPHASPRPELEQYRTPASIAAEVLFEALALGDLHSGTAVADLGCGTGMLAIGAALLGASAVGFDIDGGAIEQARRAAALMGVRASFDVADVGTLRGSYGLVLSNPPFGSQRRAADRPFLEAALRLAPVGYTFHVSETIPFVDRFLRARGARITNAWDYSFPLRWQFRFHEKAVKTIPVTVVRFAAGSIPYPAGDRAPGAHHT
jgi:putative methylase